MTSTLITSGIVSAVASFISYPIIPHLASLAVLAFASAVGVYLRSRWAVPLSILTVAFYLVASLASSYVFWRLYAAFGDSTFFIISASMALLSILTGLFLLYTVSKRRALGATETEAART